MLTIPDELQGRAFTVAEAAASGLSRRMLQGRRFQLVRPGVYAPADLPLSLPTRLSAALLCLPPDAAVSHVTNLQLRGFLVGPARPLHFSTNEPGEIDQRGIVVHRRLHPLNAAEVAGIRALGPLRTFIDAATQLDERRLLQVGDWLVGCELVTLDRLRTYVSESHLDGVVRARQVAAMVRERVGSPRESDVRWHLREGGLPAPEVNVDIHNEHGDWIARGDLVYRAYKVVVEYDGRQHELDPQQRQWDHLRREALDAAGWRLIVITEADMAAPSRFVARVRQALRSRGYRR